jgi:DNA-binding protein
MFQEDLSVFFNDFSVQATWTQGATVKTLKGIFDNGFKEFGFPAEGRNIEYLVDSSQIVGMRHGDAIAINAIAYKVASVQPHQDGALSIIKLES